MKYTDFQTITRSRSVPHAVKDKAEFAAISRGLLDDTLPLPLPIRLMGLTLSNLERDSDERHPAEKSQDTAQLSLL